MTPKFGDIGRIDKGPDTPDGLVVMFLWTDPEFRGYPWGVNYGVSLTLDGFCNFSGRGPFPPGIYGPGSIGPIAISNVDWYGP